MRLPPWIWRIVRSRRVRIGAIWAACLTPIAGVGFYHLTAMVASRAEQKQMERFKAQGIETDWQAWLSPAVDPEQDVFSHPAAVAERDRPILAGFRDLGIKGFYTGSSRAPGNNTQADLAIPARLTDWLSTPAASDSEAARQLLDTLPAGVPERWAGIREAWARPQLCWPIPSFDRFAAVKLGIRKQIDFAANHALCELASGNGGEALEDIRALLRMERHFLRSSPDLFSGILAGLAQKNGSNLIWEGVYRGVWNDAQLESLDAALVDSREGVIPSDSMRGELALTGESLRTNYSSRVGFTPTSEWGEFFKSSWSNPRAKLAYLWELAKPSGLSRLESVRYRDKLANVVLSDLGSMAEVPAPFYRSVRDQDEQNKFEVSTGRTVFFVSRYPEFEILCRFSGGMLSADARRSLLRTGIALERFRLAHGSYPERLEELVPSFLPRVLPDPFDGQPLRYQRMADGSPRVWSINLNLEDEGGLPKQSKAKGDLIWITKPIPGYLRKDYLQ